VAPTGANKPQVLTKLEKCCNAQVIDPISVVAWVRVEFGKPLLHWQGSRIGSAYHCTSNVPGTSTSTIVRGSTTISSRTGHPRAKGSSFYSSVCAAIAKGAGVSANAVLIEAVQASTPGLGAYAMDVCFRLLVTKAFCVAKGAPLFCAPPSYMASVIKGRQFKSKVASHMLKNQQFQAHVYFEYDDEEEGGSGGDGGASGGRGAIRWGRGRGATAVPANGLELKHEVRTQRGVVVVERQNPVVAAAGAPGASTAPTVAATDENPRPKALAVAHAAVVAAAIDAENKNHYHDDHRHQQQQHTRQQDIFFSNSILVVACVVLAVPLLLSAFTSNTGSSSGTASGNRPTAAASMRESARTGAEVGEEITSGEEATAATEKTALVQRLGD
jgi:hypothetical protein